MPIWRHYNDLLTWIPPSKLWSWALQPGERQPSWCRAERRRWSPAKGTGFTHGLCMQLFSSEEKCVLCSYYVHMAISKAVRYCSEFILITFSDISSWTNYRYRLSIFLEPPIIFQYSNNVSIIFYIERHPLNINCNRYILTNLWAMSSKPVVIKLDCDLRETQTNHVRSKLSDILKVY
jgi:hypothetical protein